MCITTLFCESGTLMVIQGLETQIPVYYREDKICLQMHHPFYYKSDPQTRTHYKKSEMRINLISANLGKCFSLFCSCLAGVLSARGARRHPETSQSCRVLCQCYISQTVLVLLCWAGEAAQAVPRTGVWMLCPCRCPLQPSKLG